MMPRITVEMLCGWRAIKDGARARLTLLITLIVAAQATGQVLMRPATGYGNLPLSFERNVGQSHPEVQFLARGSGYTLFLTANEAVLTLRKSEPRQSEPRPQGSGGLNPSRDRKGAGRTGTNNNPQITQNQKQSAPSAKSVDENAVLRMKLVGANPSAKAAGLDELPGKSNYFIGNDPKQWGTDVPNYGKVRFAGVYPGIDLVYYGNQPRSAVQETSHEVATENHAIAERGQRQLEHDFIVAPGGSPRSIRLRLEGAERISLEENGDLRVRLAGQELRLLRPVIYQQEGAERRTITGEYVLRAGNEVGFRVGAYDGSKPLVIDPLVLFYSSFLGGLGADEGNAIALDSAGNAYVTGSTASTNFPTRTPLQARHGDAPQPDFITDAFVTKVSPAGALVYSTYLGGSGFEIGYGIAVDSTGAAYVAGETSSNNFPVQNAAQPTFVGGNCGGPCFDAFVAKLNPAGSALVYSTYLGGSSGGVEGDGGGHDYAYAIALDPQGNAYVTGETASADFPTLNPFQREYCCPDVPGRSNAFVTKYNATGSMVYSTHLGRGNGAVGSGIAVDAAGNAYVTGSADTERFPTTPGAFQREGADFGFVTKLNPQGNGLVYSTFFGGDNSLRKAIAVDSSGNAYVTGRTANPAFPTTANAFQRTLGNRAGASTDAFVTKLNPTGTALVYSTFLGGNNEDAGEGIAVDSVGNAYVTGFTRSSNFPVSGAAQQTFGGGSCGQAVPCSDVFLTELNFSGTALVVSTFFGGNNDDEGHGIAVDAIGYPHITGFTRSRNFPTRNPFQAQYGDDPSRPPDQGSDAFITKMIEPPFINAGGTVNAASLAAGGSVAPGSIVSLFGTKFATESHATVVPLPTTLPPSPDPRGVSLRFNTTLAIPLFDTFPAQINYQVPWELEGQTSASITATASGLTSDPVPVTLTTYSPGIFSTTASGRGQGAILISTTAEIAAPTGSIPGRATRPARPGEFLTIFCTGLGPVTNRPATGAIAPTSPPLATTTATPTVTIGGEGATVSFSGLAPGFVGLYQINVPVPVTARAGNDVPVVITIGGTTSNTVTIAVQ